MNRFAAFFAVLCASSCGKGPIIVGYEPPPAPPPPVAEPVKVFPTSMGEPFAVDAPLIGPEQGLSALARAFDGRLHLLAWKSPRGVRAVRFDLAGARLDPEPIELAPPEMVSAGVAVLPLAAGGFEVLWCGPARVAGSTVTAAGLGTLYAARVSADGKTTLPSAFPGYSLRDDADVVFAGQTEPLNGVYQLVRLVSVEPDGVRVDTVGRLISAQGSYGPFRSGFPRVTVSVPQVAGRARLVHLAGRDFLATLRGNATTTLELRALPVTPGDAPEVVFSTELPLAAVDVRSRMHFALERIADRLVLVWRETAAGPVTTLRAVSVRPEPAGGFEVSPVSELVRHANHGFGEVTVAAAADSLLVGVRGTATSGYDVQSPLAVAIDPVTLTPRWTVAVDAPVEVSFQGCSWDGAACLTMIGVGFPPVYTLAKRLAPGDKVGKPFDELALPGLWNAQSMPAAACNASHCLLGWRDDRGARDGVRAIRIDKETGLPTSSASEELFSGGSGPRPALAATARGFVAAQATCGEDTASSTMQLEVRVMSAAGTWGPVQRLDLPDRPCTAWSQLVVTADGDRALVAALERDPRDQLPQLVLAVVDPDGVARLRPHALGLGQHTGLDAVLSGDRATLALQTGGVWTTVVLDLTRADADGVGVERACFTEKWCDDDPRRLVKLPGRATVGWLELDRPGRFTTGEVDWSLTWTELDAQGKPLAAARTLLAERGEAYGLEVTADERGLAVLIAQRTFASEQFTLTFRRFDAVPQPQPAQDARVVARGIYTRGHALASAGAGQWLTAYAEHGAADGNVHFVGGTSSRVFGRFVYEAPEAPLAAE